MSRTVYDVGDPALLVVERVYSEHSETVATGDPPWARDPALRTALEAAGWRYAYLVGIVEPEGNDIRTRDSDREQHSHLVRTHNGLPEWHSREATTFVCDLTGVTRQVAAAWLNLDWFGGGEV